MNKLQRFAHLLRLQRLPGEAYHSSRVEDLEALTMLDVNTPYKLSGHWYLHDYLNAPHADKCLKKVAQTGASEAELRSCLLDALQGLKVGFVLPDASLLRDFVHGRAMPSVRCSPVLKEAVTGPVSGLGTSLWVFGAGRLHWMFSGSGSSGHSHPLDRIVVDEFDRADSSYLTSLHYRMSHSSDPGWRTLSTPTYPGVGIDALYQASSQRKLLFKCTNGHWNHLSWDSLMFKKSTLGLPELKLGFPEFANRAILLPRYLAAEPYLGCTKCRVEIDAHARETSEWVDTFPERANKGWFVSRFMAARYSSKHKPVYTHGEGAYGHTAASIIADYLSLKKLKDVPEHRRQAHGEACAESTSEITRGNLDALVDPTRPYAFNSARPCTIGIDQRGKVNVVIACIQGHRVELMHAEEIDMALIGLEQTLARIGELARSYNISKGFIDQEPDINLPKAVRAIGIRPAKKMSLQAIFQENADGSVLYDKTSMYNTVAMALRGLDTTSIQLTLPYGWLDSPAGIEFTTQVGNTRATDTGTWVKTGRDDYFSCLSELLLGMVIRGRSAVAPDIGCYGNKRHSPLPTGGFLL